MKNEIVYSSIVDVPIRVSFSPYNKFRPFPPHTVAGMHIHDEVEFLRVEGGEFLCHAGGTDFTAQTGDIIYIASRVPHATETLQYGTNTTLIQFAVENYTNNSNITGSKSLYRFISNSEKPAYVFRLDSDENRLMSSYIDKICEEISNKNTGYEHFITAGIHSMIGLLYRRRILQNTESFFNNKYIDKIMPALKFIDTHYNEQITLEALSATSNMNPSYFCRVFKKATNSTFTEYLNFVRVIKSERLLTSNSGSVSDIALDVGFSSVSYFNRIFKRFKSLSPSEYRKIRYTVK